MAPGLDLNDTNHCEHSPMLKTAQFTSYRTPKHSTPCKRASWVDISRTSRIAAEMPARDMRALPNRADAPPRHQMVVLKGLLGGERRWGEFRKVVHTGLYSQIVAMEVDVGGQVGEEVHTVDQILLFTSGQAKATVAGKEQDVQASDVVVVPAGTQHRFVNTGDTPLELITIFSPAKHDPQTVHKTKEEGDQEEEEGKDEAPEWSRRSKKENEEAGEVKPDGGPYERG